MADSLTDAATQQQVYLERLKSGYDRDFKAMNKKLRENIKKVLDQIEVDTFDELTNTQLNKLLVELKKAHLAASVEAMRKFLNDLKGISKYAQGLEIAQAASLPTGSLPAIKFKAPPVGKAYIKALKAPIQATGDVLEAFVENWPKNDVIRVNKAVRVAWSQGKPTAQVVKEIVGTAKNKYEDGVLNVSKQHASTVVHTSTQHVAETSRQEVWKANDNIVKGYHWVATLDRRTTQQCKSLEELYGVGKDYFEQGKGPLPPIHPNCRSATAPKLDSKYDFLSEDSTRASSGTSNKEVDGKLTYYGWLKTQPAKFQDIALGKTRAKLFRDGGLSAKKFADLNIDRNYQPLTLKEMKAIEPAAFKAAGL